MGSAYFAPYGVGLGHASRMVMVADRLRSDSGGPAVQVAFSSFGEAASYIQMRGYKCSSVPPVEFAWSMEGGFSVKHSIANIPMWFANFARQVNREIANMTRCGPDVVVSDSRLSPIFAGRSLAIPSVVVLNQIKLLLSPRLRQLAIARLFEAMVGEFLGTMWGAADRILVPDLPPPYTISAHNVWGIGSAASKLEYVGFASPRPDVKKERVDKVLDALGFSRSRPIVFVHISGPAQTRLPLVQLALEAMGRDELAGVQFVVSEGRPGGRTEPGRIGGSGWYYEWCPVRDEIFALSDLLVMRGGHTALSQAIQFGKPVVTVPIENHGEQLGNSAKVAGLGLGVMLKPKGLTAEQLAGGISSALGDLDQYRRRAEGAMGMTEKLDGIANVAKVVRSYL